MTKSTGLPLLLVSLITLSGTAQDDRPKYESGLKGTYTQSGIAVSQVDESLSFSWTQDQRPNPRFGDGPFRVQWSGFLLVQSSGSYQFSAFAKGRFRIRIGNTVVLTGSSREPKWFVSSPRKMEFDFHNFEVQFDGASEDSEVHVFWRGPRFSLEPIPPKFLYRKPEATSEESFHRGMQLSRALRCSACHQLGPKAIAAPSLENLSGHVNQKWLTNWLLKNHKDKDSTLGNSRRMPYFNLTQQDCEQLASYLMSKKRLTELKLPKVKKIDSKAGEQTLLTKGCMACHTYRKQGTQGLFAGADLSEIGDKRNQAFLHRWLTQPASLNAQHRMPQFEFSKQELVDLTTFLTSLKTADSKKVSESNESDITAGQKLYKQLQCASCHDTKAEQVVRSLKGDQPCWETNAKKEQPYYHLNDKDKASLKIFVEATVKHGKVAAAPLSGSQLLTENNCTTCHERIAGGGIKPVAVAIGKQHPRLNSLLPAMIPPSLISVGDKLKRTAMSEVIAQKKRQGRRPWLKVQMPKFRLADKDMERIIEHFVARDRIPDGSPVRLAKATGTKKGIDVAGSRLVTTAGFGCTSCHAIGSSTPPKAPLNALGPDLSMLQDRIRRPWYDRWVRNPSRIVPQMEMPSLQASVKGVLNDRLDDQLDAVWQVLNRPGFTPPRPNPVRVVRRNGNRQDRQRAVVLTDVLHFKKKVLIKPLLVGLPNRHNLLFDMTNNQLLAWTVGDAALQRTKGKTWFWELGGTEVAQIDPVETELQLRVKGKLSSPELVGQFITEIAGLKHLEGGIRVVSTLRFRIDNSPTLVRVVQDFTVSGFGDQGHSHGIRRRIDVVGVPATAEVVFNALSKQDGSMVSGNLAVLNKDDRVELRVRTPGAQLSATGQVSLQPTADRRRRILVVDYLCNLGVDRFPKTKISIPAPTPVALEVVPGFEARRLPLGDEIMPTGLSWKPDGTLVMSSLKGRVWTVADSNKDGLEDKLTAISEELAAPFGVYATDQYVDVINKYSLIRLLDDDGDGKTDRHVTLASGWGHTADYHDWATGLPRDEKGNYYVAFSCQQDDRNKAAAHLRGSVVQLQVDPEADIDQPYSFAIKELTAGHRFPIGIARNRAGALFVTDNQGNYNPFNELNHIIKGRRFGFINKIDRKKGFSPPLTPPSIDIPHPWTRSVNGICFLDSPTAKRSFGPYEGHLIGCEYDTRRLIRMTLQKVNGQYQGAAYPFSYDTPSSGEPLIGPLVAGVSPNGDLYIGSIRDSGWGGANNIGSIVQMRFNPKKLKPGIREILMARKGFIISFVGDISKDKMAQKENYSALSFTRVSTPAYGGSDRERRNETIKSVRAIGPYSVFIELGKPTRKGFVYEFHVKNIGSQKNFFPDVGYYTAREVPE